MNAPSRIPRGGGATARQRTERLQRGVIILPSALTLGNLFFGFWAVVAATRGMFGLAAWLIVFAAVADLLDGRVARITRTGTRFGAELDSLVDAISFGVAPALIMYHLFLADGTWGWIAGFVYVMGAVLRLARFNVAQGGEAKVAFHGLPSPTAGVTLATFYPFSQTEFFLTHLAGLPWPGIMTTLMILLALLMISHVLYPVVPTFGFRTPRGILTFFAMIGVVICVFTIPSLFFFPAALAYISYGVGKAIALGFFERLPDRDLLLDTEEVDDSDAELREIDYRELQPPRRLWWPRLRRQRPGAGKPGSTPRKEKAE